MIHIYIFLKVSKKIEIIIVITEKSSREEKIPSIFPSIVFLNVVFHRKLQQAEESRSPFTFDFQRLFNPAIQQRVRLNFLPPHFSSISTISHLPPFPRSSKLSRSRDWFIAKKGGEVESKEYYETEEKAVRRARTADTYDPITPHSCYSSNYGKIYTPINNRGTLIVAVHRAELLLMMHIKRILHLVDLSVNSLLNYYVHDRITEMIYGRNGRLYSPSLSSPHLLFLDKCSRGTCGLDQLIIKR